MPIPAATAAPSSRATTPSHDEGVPSGKFVAPPLPTERQAAWGLGLFGLFLLPFCAIGVWTGCAAIGRALAGDWNQAAFYTLFCLVFGGVGFGLLTTVVLGRAKVVDAIARAHAHPDEPWLWRADWAAKLVHDGVQVDMWRWIFFATLWNLISIPLVVAVVRQELPKGNHLALIALLFPLVGVGLATYAIRRTLQYRRFGTSSLELERVPIPVGERLVGTVRAGVAAPPADGFRVVLSRINRVTTGRGDDESTSEYIQWQEERRVRGAAVRDFHGAGATIPVDFAIPADARGTDESAPRNAIVWRLSVAASLPGVDYESAFDVPIYYTAESMRAAPETRERFAADVRPDPTTMASPITITAGVDGTTILFPPFRNPGPTLGLAAFAITWTSTIWLQRHLGAPFVFPVLTGLVASVLWWAVLAMAFGSSRAVVRPDGLVVTHRFLGIPRRRSIAAGDVAGIETPIQMQTGSTPYYSILVRRRAIAGRQLAGAITVATGIRDKREVERLAATIGEALGRMPVPGRVPTR
jgi:hypothetical protein